MLETDTLPQPEEQAHLAAEASELRDFVRHSTVRVEARGGQGGQRIFRYVAGDLAIEAPEKPAALSPCCLIGWKRIGLSAFLNPG